MPCSMCGQAGHNISTCPEESKKAAAAHPILEIDMGVRDKLQILAGICREVAGGLKKGRVEGVYQNAVCQELQERHISYVAEETIPILYKGKFVGIERIDVCLTSWLDFIFEFKAVASDIRPEHLWQVISYLNQKGYNHGAVVNFNQSVKGDLQIQFVVKKGGEWFIYDLETDSGNRLEGYGGV